MIQDQIWASVNGAVLSSTLLQVSQTQISTIPQKIESNNDFNNKPKFPDNTDAKEPVIMITGLEHLALYGNNTK